MPYIKPTSDIFIKYLFGSEENKDLLLEFINAVLEDSGFPLITSVEIKNPFNLKTIVFEKETILDIKAKDERGKIYNIEVQVTGTDVFKHRSLYYWAKLYSSQLQAGEEYASLYPVICINILEFTLFQDINRYHLHFMLKDTKDAGLYLTEHLAIHYLELPKMRDLDMQSNLSRWLYYLKNEGKDEEDEYMKILLKDDPEIRKAHEKYDTFTRDEELIDAYEAHMKWKRDYNTGIAAAKREGLKEGLEKGRSEIKAMLLEAIELKFGIITKEIREKIEATESTERIRSFLKEVLTAKSLEEFSTLLDK